MMYHCGACGEVLAFQGGVWFHETLGRYFPHVAEPVRTELGI